jgi:hypothetical protein
MGGAGVGTPPWVPAEEAAVKRLGEATCAIRPWALDE